MSEKIGNILKGQIVTSIIYIVFGACLAFMPVSTVNIICKFLFGVLLIRVGTYHISTYVADKLSATILDLFAGGVLFVLGIFLFMNPQIVIKLLPILLGTFILADSIWTLKGAVRLKKRGSGFWKYLLLGSLIFVGLGIALILNPFAMVKYTVMFAGWIFLCNGVADLVFFIMLRKGLKEIVQDLTAVDTEGQVLDKDDIQPEKDEAEAPKEDDEQTAEPAAWSSRGEDTVTLPSDDAGADPEK